MEGVDKEQQWLRFPTPWLVREVEQKSVLIPLDREEKFQQEFLKGVG